MRILLWIFLSLSLVACDVTVPGSWSPKGFAPEASPQIKILGIEGMGDTGALAEGFAPLVAKYHVIYQHSTWQGWGAFAHQHWDLIAGHSLGGQSAMDIVSWQLRNGVKPPAELMTLAARHQSVASWFDFLVPLGIQGFTAPIANTHNFYTIGLLSSQPIAGAAVNDNVSSFSTWHGNVPSAPDVQADLEKFLKGGK